MYVIVILFFFSVVVAEDILRAVTHLQEVSHQVVDSDPAVQPFLLAGEDGGALEVKWQRAQVRSQTFHDSLGLLHIFHSDLKQKKMNQTNIIIALTEYATMKNQTCCGGV